MQANQRELMMSTEIEEMSLDEKREHLGEIRLRRKELIDKLRECNTKRNVIAHAISSKSVAFYMLFNSYFNNFVCILMFILSRAS